MAKTKSSHSGKGAYVPSEMWGGLGRGGPGYATHIQRQRASNMAVSATRRRIGLISILFVLCFVVISGRLVYVTQFLPTGAKHLYSSTSNGPFDRSDIVDRNGIILATNIPTYTLKAKPGIVWHPAETADRLAEILDNADRDWIFARLTSNRQEVRLKTHVTPRQHAQVMEMGMAGLFFKKSHRRVYPMGRETSHVVGFVDVDNKGRAGIEKSLETEILEAAKIGDNVGISIDTRLQFILREELVNSVEKFSAQTGAGIVMDVHTGEVLALSSVPDFDPNIRSPKLTQQQNPSNNSSLVTNKNFNIVTNGVYELGSVFKVFTVAMGLDRGTINLASGYDTSQPLRFGRFKIDDFHGKKRWLNISEILIHSSNIGAAKIARDVGIPQHKEFIRSIGMYEPANIELPEIGSPKVPDRWPEVSAATISYGHGIAVSPLQVAAAGAAVVNGGMFLKPTLRKITDENQIQGQRVLSEKTSSQMRSLLRMVVSNGTGRKADVDGYEVGGKTGTADKSVNGRYASRAVISSFLASFPMNNPKYVVYVMLDNPKGIPETFGHATAGWTAAPLAGSVIQRIGPVLGMRPHFEPVYEQDQDGLLKVAAVKPSVKPGLPEMGRYGEH